MSNWIDTIFDPDWRGISRGIPAKLSQRIAGATDQLLNWQERVKQRRALSRLDQRMLKDIGVDPSEAWREVQKPFWRQ